MLVRFSERRVAPLRALAGRANRGGSARLAHDRGAQPRLFDEVHAATQPGITFDAPRNAAAVENEVEAQKPGDIGVGDKLFNPLFDREGGGRALEADRHCAAMGAASITGSGSHLTGIHPAQRIKMITLNYI